MTITENIQYVQVTCFKGGEEFTFAWTDDYEYDPETNPIACIPCARALGDTSMYRCLNCGAQFQSEQHGIFEPEGCSRECENAIDLAVDRAQERQIAAHEARMEAL